MEGVPMIFASSVVYLIASSIRCNQDQCIGVEIYAILVALLSLFITLSMMILSRSEKSLVLSMYHKYISGFLFVWWIIGASVGTFEGPFQDVGNGYFSAWAALLFSCQYIYTSNDAVKGVMDKGASMFMGKNEANAGNNFQDVDNSV